MNKFWILLLAVAVITAAAGIDSEALAQTSRLPPP